MAVSSPPTNFKNPRPARRILVIILLVFLLTYWNSWYFDGEAFYKTDVRSKDESTRIQGGSSLNETSKVAKVTVAINPPSYWDRVLKSHKVQNELHGYQHFLGDQPLVFEKHIPNRPYGTWSKPAYVLELLLHELGKPEDQRLEWLFWFDADTIILNPHIRLETFLPPEEDGLRDVHLLLASNWDGINAGIFPIRVHPWSVTLLSSMIAYEQFRPSEKLEFQDQSALSHILHQFPDFRANWTVVPHRWFNSLPINMAFDENGTWIYATPMTLEEFDDGEEISDLQPWKVLKGDMALHFAGARVRQSWMDPWLDRLELYLPEWSSSVFQERLEVTCAEFWKEEKVKLEKKTANFLRLDLEKKEDEVKRKEEQQQERMKKQGAGEKEHEQQKQKQEEEKQHKASSDQDTGASEPKNNDRDHMNHAPGQSNSTPNEHNST
ncbi:putative galactosyl transferase gma12 mnn10 family protein [Phaeomoniella chlamydospora]|uniref:Putative galactosyl transferase gma12 mnn10 family protein n=1 Tax=Phaeomoniella chlamydospora TaxID=158046 RepID=A0A0G2EY12_PHACM|nr:putative galactosyl transferase gma12 mnn10 family protein [Phaeomoniella chlamydospora]